MNRLEKFFFKLIVSATIFEKNVCLRSRVSEPACFMTAPAPGKGEQKFGFYGSGSAPAKYPGSGRLQLRNPAA